LDFPQLYDFMSNSISQLGKQVIQLAVFLCFMAIAPSQAQAYQLRVAIAQKIPEVKIGTSTIAIVRDETGKNIGELPPSKGIVAKVNGEKVVVGDSEVTQLFVEPQNGGYVWINDRWYRGKVQVLAVNGQLTAIDIVNIEHYLYSVLGAEMSATFPAEALKAQAVAARTYALYRSQSARKKLFDVDNTEASQVYKGLSTEANTTQAAVKATSGEVMTYNGKLILAAFHSASGGHTENVEDIWSNALPYLRGVPDDDMGTPGYGWSKTFSLAQLSESLNIPNIKAIVPDRTTQFGTVLSLKASGDNEQILTGDKIRSTLKLRSLRFTITPTPEGFIFNGLGYGHALGLSQWGAYNMAQKGVKYSSILTHYYQGASLGKVGG
jgi:stage II sporulation protein D